MGTGADGPRPDAGDAVTVDNRGRLCAQGIVRLMRALTPLAAGQVVRVLSTDPAAEHDYPAWCRHTGHPFIGTDRAGDLIISWLRKRTP